jgi:hypothetical protein
VKSKVYVETTIVSHLIARPSRDLVHAAQQEVTRDWWDDRHAFDLFISQLVLDEAARGDPDAAALRLGALGDATVLDTTEEATWTIY